MNAHPRYIRIAFLSALAAGACLVGTIILPFVIALIVGARIGGDISEPPPTFVAAMIVLTLAMLVGGGALWGLALARIAGYPRARRLVVATALSYAPCTLAAAFVLSQIEPVVAGGAQNLPIHVLFRLLFVPAVFAVAAVTGGALGAALWNPRISASLALRGGLAAGLAFLAVDLILDSLGMRVGAPNAAASTTMLKVMAISNLGAALAGGAAIGVALARYVAAQAGRAGAIGTPSHAGGQP